MVRSRKNIVETVAAGVKGHQIFDARLKRVTAKIAHVIGREILDSRGNPTVEADVILANGLKGRASVHSDGATGEHEAIELRDGDKSRYLGKGTHRAVANIADHIAPALLGADAERQSSIDRLMLSLDGTDNKSNLGANAILAVSMA